MSQKEKQYEYTSSILMTAYNLATKLMEYQNTKKTEAREFAKKIDRLTLIARKREKRQIRNPITDVEKKQVEEDMKNEDEFNHLLIDTLTVVDGLLSSPAGGDRDFLISSVRYLRQKNSEKRKGLTSYYIQDVRDAFLLRLAQDIKVWDAGFRETLLKTLSIVQNVAVGFSGDKEHNQNPNEKGQQKAEEPTERNNQSEDLGVT